MTAGGRPFHTMKYPRLPRLACVAAFSVAAASLSSLSAAPLLINASADTWLQGPSSNVANSNNGVSTQLDAGIINANDVRHIVLRFDLSGIAAGSTINSVTLNTVAVSGDGSSQTSLTLNVFELIGNNANWIEGTGAVNSGASWNTRNGATAWLGGANGAGIAGTDYTDSLLASFTGNPQTITAGTSMGYNSESAFATAVANNSGGSLNLVLLRDDSATARNFFRIASRENTTLSAPSLSVDFTPVPEPSTIALGMVALIAVLVFRRRRLCER